MMLLTAISLCLILLQNNWYKRKRYCYGNAYLFLFIQALAQTMYKLNVDS